jgi:hypothetical protein
MSPSAHDNPRRDTNVSQPVGSAQETALGLSWGIKRSFVDYVRQMPDGQSALGEGAVIGDGGDYVFPPLRSARRAGPGNTIEQLWEFGGDVRFGGHFGMLFVRIAFPVISVRDGLGELTIADPYVSDGGARLALATVSMVQQPASDGQLIWLGSDVRLSAVGCEVFNNVYPVGELFDPLTIVVPPG